LESSQRLRDIKYIGFKHQTENKQNSDKIIKDVFLKLEDVSQSSCFKKHCQSLIISEK